MTSNLISGPECHTLAACMECMCGIESNENARTCGTEHGPDETCTMHGRCNNRDLSNRTGDCLCGSWQISRSYFDACSTGHDPLGNALTVPIADWVSCAVDVDCATKCVHNYLNKYRLQCTGTTDASQVSCAQHWRIHRGGPNGCLIEQPGETNLASCCTTPGQ